MVHQGLPRPGGAKQAARPPRMLRVMVADDVPDTVTSLLELLRDEGYEVRGVYRGKDVMDAVCDFSPDVVLLDIGMPGMDGYEVARSLRERYGSARPTLFAVTARNKDADRLMSRLAGFDRHITKPYDPRELMASLAALQRDR
ncbi:MAG: response regulator [Betaproteobacteria bacterium]